VALQNGLWTLDLQLLHDASERMENGHVAVPDRVSVRTVDDAISVLSYHKKQMAFMRPAWNAKPVDVEAVKRSIVRQAAALNSKRASFSF